MTSVNELPWSGKLNAVSGRRAAPATRGLPALQEVQLQLSDGTVLDLTSPTFGAGGPGGGDLFDVLRPRRSAVDLDLPDVPERVSSHERARAAGRTRRDRDGNEVQALQQRAPGLAVRLHQRSLTRKSGGQARPHGRRQVRGRPPTDHTGQAEGGSVTRASRQRCMRWFPSKSGHT